MCAVILIGYVVADPRDWTGEHISRWVDWASHNLSLPGISPASLPCTGHDLCLLTAEQFSERLGEAAGRALHQHLRYCMSR